MTIRPNLGERSELQSHLRDGLYSHVWLVIKNIVAGIKLKRQYFGHKMRRANSLGKTLMPGKIEGRRKRANRG